MFRRPRISRGSRSFRRAMLKLINEAKASQDLFTSVNPDQENPDQKNPDQKNPDQKNPDQKNPDQKNPDQKNPDQKNPDQKNPDQKNPDQKNPDQKNPDQKNPDQKNPDQKNPDQKNPDQKNPDQKNPDQKNPKPEESKQTDINHYRFQSTRLKSFIDWPYFLKKNCAASGFYYTGVDDEVKCFACQATISNWNSHFNLRRFHKPNCNFNNSLSNNVSISVNPNTISTDCQTESRTEGVRGYNLAELSDSVSNKRQKLSKTEYNMYDNRLESYAKWPKQLSRLKEQLAAAGFYYTGKDDVTKCFTCNEEISRWVLDDDPWKKHAKYSKMCEYLFITKGRKYVYNVIKRTSSKQEFTSTDTSTGTFMSKYC